MLMLMASHIIMHIKDKKNNPLKYTDNGGDTLNVYRLTFKIIKKGID